MNDKRHDDMPADLAENERWLASFSTPSPSAAVIRRTKAALRAELARQARPDSLNGLVAAGLAVAAMLVLAVGLMRFAAPWRDPDAIDAMDLFAASLESVMDQQDLELTVLQEDVAEYEAQLVADLSGAGGWLEPYGAELLEATNGLVNDQDAPAAG